MEVLTSTTVEAKLRALKPILLEQYAVDKIGYFGSFAREEQTSTSDIDILISPARPLGWNFFELKELLEDALEMKVDLITQNALKSKIKARNITASKIYMNAPKQNRCNEAHRKENLVLNSCSLRRHAVIFL